LKIGLKTKDLIKIRHLKFNKQVLNLLEHLSFSGKTPLPASNQQNFCAYKLPFFTFYTRLPWGYQKQWLKKTKKIIGRMKTQKIRSFFLGGV